jgi:hypothetical protein
MKYVGQVSCFVGKNNKRCGANGRWSRHVSKALTGKQPFSDTTIWAAIKKHGAINFEIAVLETCPKERTDEREAYYIKTLNTLYPNGYNNLSGNHQIPVEKKVSQELSSFYSTARKETMPDLPMYMVYVKARPETYCGEGFAIINHPKSRPKYFCSKKLSLDEKRGLALNYLNILNAVEGTST